MTFSWTRNACGKYWDGRWEGLKVECVLSQGGFIFGGGGGGGGVWGRLSRMFPVQKMGLGAKTFGCACLGAHIVLVCRRYMRIACMGQECMLDRE